MGRAGVRGAVIVIAAAVVLHLVTLDRRPAVWFDEGFRFNAGRLLAETGTFGSRSAAGIVPFDQALTSGPLEVSLVALSFSALGRGVAQGRLPFLLLAVASVLLVWRIALRAFGPFAARVMVLVVVAAPPLGGVGVAWFGRQALSETPALAVMLLALSAWVRSLASPRPLLALAAGLGFGVAVLSKPQFAIALFPTLAILAAARWAAGLDPLRRAVLPMVGATAAVAWWSTLATLLTPTAIRQQNAASLWQGLQANIVTDLWGSGLGRAALLIAVAGALATAWGAWRLRSAWRRDRRSDATWTLAALTLLTAFNTVWFVLFSNGWPRYGYLGYVTALMLIGLALAEAARRAGRVLNRWRPGVGRLAPRLVWVALVIAAVPAVVLPTIAGPASSAATRMAEFIEAYVPDSAVIETWEWELSGLGAHTAFHFPSQRFLYLSTYQQSRRLPFSLPYRRARCEPRVPDHRSLQRIDRHLLAVTGRRALRAVGRNHAVHAVRSSSRTGLALDAEPAARMTYLLPAALAAPAAFAS